MPALVVRTQATAMHCTDQAFNEAKGNTSQDPYSIHTPSTRVVVLQTRAVPLSKKKNVCGIATHGLLLTSTTIVQTPQIQIVSVHAKKLEISTRNLNFPSKKR